MRKRAQIRAKTFEEPKHISRRTIEPIKRGTGIKINWTIISLIGIFFLVLLLNTGFNFSSDVSINPDGTGLDKYYLSGPDPYYNMRLVSETLYGDNAGHYPFYSSEDPLLNYPLGRSGARPPLLNMMAISFSRLLTPFMDDVDAVGYSMQFVPALFGALIVFPVFYIGKIIFNKKAGIVAALVVALIPIHIGSGHGSAFSLFDHDSLNLLLYFLAFLFLIKGIKEKDKVKSVLYAAFSGFSIAALNMTWVEAQFLSVIIAFYTFVQIIVDIFTDKKDLRVPRTSLIALFVGYIVAFPVRSSSIGFGPDIPFFLIIAIAIFGFFVYIFDKKKIPWTVSLPAIVCVGSVSLAFLYFVDVLSIYVPILGKLIQLRNIIFGSGIYGNKVAMTIAEASTSNISRTVMSFGPALYWIAWTGFLLLAYSYIKHKRRDYLFLIVLFVVDMWLTSIAGRFLNDMVPVVALFGGWMTWIVIDKIEYKKMIRNIGSIGGVLRGLRRAVKILHIVGILFVALLVILPNSYLAFDAAIPFNEKREAFGEGAPQGAFGLIHGKEAYWVDAYSWLSKQDNDIENITERPAFISWWDYGFYEVAVGGHPVVADNFQDGIPTAANFHTATSEKEAITIWIVRLLEGDISDNGGKLSDDVVQAFKKYLDENDTSNVTKWMENQDLSPSYHTPIGAEYNEELSKQHLVGEQYSSNAVYHDISNLLVDRLTDEEITRLYHDIQEVTGRSIRYYGVEGYDKQIFNIFGFLADKSLLLVAGGESNPEDDFIKMKFTGYNVDPNTGKKLSDGEWTFEEINSMSKDERRYIVITGTRPEYKDAYFETMFYKTYIGPYTTDQSGKKQEPNYQLPCINMKHFAAEYISNISEYQYYQGKSAVVIAKYYEGAYVNGSILFKGEPVDNAVIVVQKNITHYNKEIPVDHDSSSTNEDGEFNVIAPAGRVRLQIRKDLGLGANNFILKNVTFDGTDELAPITDDEAMRKPGTDYERVLNITIEPAVISGYVYEDKNDNKTFDPSTDEPVKNAKITMSEISQFTSSGGETNSNTVLTTDDNGYYNASGLMPGYYFMRVEKDGFIIYEKLMTLNEGNNTYNISKLKTGSIKGTVYFDLDKNGKYDEGEEMSGVTVNITYQKLAVDGKTVIENITIGSMQTAEDGKYSFASLTPGQYLVDVTKGFEYKSNETIQLSENENATYNISIDYAPIELSGYTTYNGEHIDGVTVTLRPDENVENNTAVTAQTISNENGFYSMNVMPGSYNVEVNKKVGEVQVYLFEGAINISIGEKSKTYDISLNKVSTTLNGTTMYSGSPVDNVTIDFAPDHSIENNTARHVTVKSDTDGTYQLEITPGSYTVTVEEKKVTIGGQNYTYTYSGSLKINEGELSKTFDIILVREES